MRPGVPAGELATSLHSFIVQLSLPENMVFPPGPQFFADFPCICTIQRLLSLSTPHHQRSGDKEQQFNSKDRGSSKLLTSACYSPPTPHPYFGLPSSMFCSRACLFPRRPVLCESLPGESLPVDPPRSSESIQQQLSGFCEKYSIPSDCHPVWTKHGDTDILRFGIPSTSPIYDIMLSLAEYRTAVTRHRSSTTASSPPLSQHMSNSVSMESRTVNNQSRVRLVITPRTRLPDNSREPPTVIEVTSPLQSSSVSSAPVVPHISVELRKASGFINSDDIKTVELALYLGHIKSPSPKINHVKKSLPESFEDPFDGFFQPFLNSTSRNHLHDNESLEDQFFKSIQSSLFGPDIFSLFGSFPSENIDDEQSFHLGHPINTANMIRGALEGDDVQQINPKRPFLRSDEQQIKRKLESMGAKVYLPSDEKESLEWSDLAGYDDAKKLIEETLLLGLTHPEIFNKVTAATRGKAGESSRPRMILFNGPPGTGKTSTARIIASQVKLPLIYVSLECIVSKWFGESERNLGTIFDLARSLGQLHTGCIIFVDEIDSLAASRDDLTSHEASRRILSILLRRLDGFDTQSDKTVLICATNRERDLDEAFRSRVDVTVYFPLPEHQGRCHIIKRYAKHLTEKEVDTLANYTTNLSGRNIRDLCQTAERCWVAHLLRESGVISSVGNSVASVEPSNTSGPVSFAISPPPLDFYLSAAERKQTQQS